MEMATPEEIVVETLDPERLTDRIISEYKSGQDTHPNKALGYRMRSGKIYHKDTTFFFRKFSDGHMLEIWAAVELVSLAAIKVGSVFQFQRPELRARVDLYRHDVEERRGWLLKAVTRICSFVEQERARQLSVGRLWDLFNLVEDDLGDIPMLRTVSFMMKRRWRSWRDFGMECSLQQSDELLKFLAENYEQVKSRTESWKSQTEDLLFSL